MQCTAQARPLAAARVAPRAPSSSSAFAGGCRLHAARLSLQARSPRRQVTRMGLFGLGVPELAVIAGVAALIFGEKGFVCGLIASRGVNRHRRALLVWS